MLARYALLLRLPAVLRQHTLLQSTAPARIVADFLKYSQTRAFRPSAKVLQKQVPPPRPTKFPLLNRSQKAPSPGRLRLSDSSEEYASRLTEHGPVLLYASPNHRLFYLMSFLSGAGLLLGAYEWAIISMATRPDGKAPPWYLAVWHSIEVIILAGMATAFVLAPRHLVRSIVLARSTQTGQHVLRIKVKSHLPFLMRDFEAPPAKLGSLSLVRNIKASVEDIHLHNVQLADAQSFTEQYFSPRGLTPPGPSIANQITHPWLLLKGSWSAFNRDVRRMFLLDQMSQASINGQGEYKIDLQNCYLLHDRDPVLFRFATVEDNRRGVLGWLSGFRS